MSKNKRLAAVCTVVGGELIRGAEKGNIVQPFEYCVSDVPRCDFVIYICQLAGGDLAAAMSSERRIAWSHNDSYKVWTYYTPAGADL